MNHVIEYVCPTFIPPGKRWLVSPHGREEDESSEAASPQTYGQRRASAPRIPLFSCL